MRSGVSVTTFTLLISTLTTFSLLRRLFSMLFQSVFYYWKLYNKFEYRIAMSHFKNLTDARMKHGRANPIFRTELSARSSYLYTLARLTGVLYVTPDHLHRYRKPTARNCVTWDLHAHRWTRLFVLFGLCTRNCIIRAGRKTRKKNPTFSQKLCDRFFFSFTDKIAAIYTRCAKFSQKVREVFIRPWCLSWLSHADIHSILTPSKAEATDL